LRENLDIIEDHAWVTSNIYKIPELKVSNFKAKDQAMMSESYIRLLGVTPTLHNSAHR
jgi:hypothetical protein